MPSPNRSSRQRRATGRAILVGAGPGDPDLLTLRAARALGEADLILYDALVDARTLALAPLAQRFFVGKRAGGVSTRQETIHALMIRAARAGKVVVRLKAGDPFVLGRGGEEAIALDAAGVDVEIVSGITSAIAGPASAGIPVTHRDVSPGFLVLSAVPDAHYRRVLSALPPDAVTVVLLMAIGNRGEIASFLRSIAWPGALPVAMVLGAHTVRQWSWVGTLASLGAVELPADRADLPGLLVIGSVVSLAETIQRATRSEAGDAAASEEETPWRRMQAR